MSKAQFEAHQRKHGFLRGDEVHQATIAKLNEGFANPMNKTEREYSMILEAQKRKGEILRWEFEGITLKWGGLRYTPDFMVIVPTHPIPTVQQFALRFIETKGPFIRDDAMVKFKAARAHYPEFQFEMWQRKGGWHRIH